MSNYVGTCDWGGCDEETVALRYWPGEGWLSVCQLHMDQANPEDVMPLPREIDDGALNPNFHFSYEHDHRDTAEYSLRDAGISTGNVPYPEPGSDEDKRLKQYVQDAGL